MYARALSFHSHYYDINAAESIIRRKMQNVAPHAITLIRRQGAKRGLGIVEISKHLAN